MSVDPNEQAAARVLQSGIRGWWTRKLRQFTSDDTALSSPQSCCIGEALPADSDDEQQWNDALIGDEMVSFEAALVGSGDGDGVDRDGAAEMIGVHRYTCPYPLPYPIPYPLSYPLP